MCYTVPQLFYTIGKLKWLFTVHQPQLIIIGINAFTGWKICKHWVRPKSNCCILCIGFYCLHQPNVPTRKPKRGNSLSNIRTCFQFLPFRYVTVDHHPKRARRDDNQFSFRSCSCICSLRLCITWRNRISKIFVSRMASNYGMACGNTMHRLHRVSLPRSNQRPDNCSTVC